MPLTLDYNFNPLEFHFIEKYHEYMHFHNAGGTEDQQEEVVTTYETVN